MEYLTRQIRHADRHDLDCLIVGRGGGSPEDLWSFNSESVVRAVFECETPVISAVGHQDDTTLIDHVCDVKAATPTDAANKIINQFSNMDNRLMQFESKIIDVYKSKLTYNKNKFDLILSKPVLSNHEIVFNSQKENFEKIHERFKTASGH